MPSRGKNQISKTPSRGKTNSEVSSSSNVQSSQHAPLSHAALVDAVSKRQKERDTRTADRKAESEALKNIGNDLFQKGDYEAAVCVYIEAIELFGRTAVLNSNLAAAYLKLGQHASAADAATDALMRDPKNIKARYRRGLARKGLGNYTGAIIDFKAVLEQDSTRTEARDQMIEAQELFDDYGDEHDGYSSEEEEEWPLYDDDPIGASDAESDSSDCRHSGNSVPCRFYNHGGCARKESCKFSHAPDKLSERDKLGRNVCIYYLFDACKYGDGKCSYAHDKSFLPLGWWNDTDAVVELQRCFHEMRYTNADVILHIFVLKQTRRGKGKAKDVPTVSRHETSTSTLLSGNSLSPYILLLALDGDVTEDYKLPTIAALQGEIVVKKALTPNEALTHFPSPNLKAIFVADAAIADLSNSQVLTKLVEYVRGGGSVVIGGSFSSWINSAEMEDFFKAWGLSWKRGSYHRATFTLNRSHAIVKSSPSTLPDSYSMKALHVHGFEASAAIYRETGVSASESPAVQSSVGKGRVGYIGDVNWESGSIAVLLAMLGLSKSFAKSAAVPSTSTVSLESYDVPVNSASRAGGETSGNKDTGPRERYVLIVALGGGFDDGISADYKQPTINLLKSKSPVKVSTTSSDAIKLLSSGDIASVFVADAGITARKNAQVLRTLVEYTRIGGTVVLGGSFSTFVKVGDLGKFFLKSWSLPWKAGSYHRTTFTLNSDHTLAKANPSLPKSYSMKALHVKDISPDVVVYQPTTSSRLESLAFASTPINNLAESPAVQAHFGQGYLGYIGDVNWEEGSSKLLFAMLGLSNPQSTSRPKAGASTTTTAQPGPSSAPKPSPTTRSRPKVDASSTSTAQSGALSALKPSSTKPATASTLKVNAASFTPPYVAETKPQGAVSAVGETSFKTLPVGRTRRPFVMVLSFGSEKFFAGVQGDLLELLRSKLEVLHGLSNERVDELIGSQDLVGILITDAGIADTKNAYILFRLVAFAKAGGTVVLGGSFSSGIKFDEMRPFFENAWGIPWRSGDYTNCEVKVNNKHELVKSSGLPSPWYMKGLFLVGVTPETAVYVPIRVGAGDVLQAPVALERVGKGKLGYIGDVGLQDEHSKIVLAMFGLTV